MGDPADAPPPLVYEQDVWFQGEPDIIGDTNVNFPHPIPGRPITVDMYRCFIMSTSEPLDDKFIIGMEVRPSNLQAAHHAVVYLADEAEALAAQAADTSTAAPNDGYECFGGSGLSSAISLTGWAPGSNSIALLNENLGIRVPPGLVVVNQMHYHLEEGDSPITDRTLLGFKAVYL